MKLSEFEKRYESRAKCADALGVSYQSFTNMCARKTEVEELKNGDWIVVNRLTKRFVRDDTAR